MSAMNDPVIEAMRAELMKRVGIAGVRALELHGRSLLNERYIATDEVERFGGMLRMLSSEEGAAEALRALAGEEVSAGFTAPWAAEREKRSGVRPRPRDVEIATGVFMEPFAKPAPDQKEPDKFGRVTIMRLAAGGLELQVDEGFYIRGENKLPDPSLVFSEGRRIVELHVTDKGVKPSLVFSSRRDLEEGPDAADLVLPGAVYHRNGRLRVSLPAGGIDPSRRWLHVIDGPVMKLSAELRFTIAPAPALPSAPASQEAQADDVVVYPDDDDDEDEAGASAAGA